MSPDLKQVLAAQDAEASSDEQRLALLVKDAVGAGRLFDRLRGPVQRADLTALDWTMKRIAAHAQDPGAHAQDLRREIDQAHEQIRALVTALEDAQRLATDLGAVLACVRVLVPRETGGPTP